MTLCIAAITNWDGEDAVVAAFDQRVSTDSASSDSELKYIPLTPSWGAMIAGPVAQAHELASLYRTFLEKEPLSQENLVEQLKVPIRAMRTRLANDLTHDLVGISRDDFLENGRHFLSDEMFRHVETQVSMRRIEAQLILFGCLDKTPRVFVCSEGTVTESGNFTAIGSGSVIATSTLHGRSQQRSQDVTRTIYNVYEAMRLGRNAPGVGPCRVMLIFKPMLFDKGWRFGAIILAPAMFKTLDGVFAVYGPKLVPDSLPEIKLPNLTKIAVRSPIPQPYTEDDAETDDSPATTGEERS